MFHKNRVRLIQYLSFSLLFLTTSSVYAFEGKVVFNMNDGISVMQLTYMLKDKLIRTEIAGGSMGTAVAIIDLENNMTTMLIKEMQMYMEVSLDSIQGETSNEVNSKDATNVKKTGKTMEILGYSCDQYIVENDEGSRAEIWATTELGSFFPFDKTGSKNSSSAQA